MVRAGYQAALLLYRCAFVSCRFVDHQFFYLLVLGGKESVKFAREFPTLDGAAAAGSGGKAGLAATQLDLRPQSKCHSYFLCSLLSCVFVYQSGYSDLVS